MDTFTEQPLVMQCRGERIFGILATPRQALGAAVLIVVGGPQYRVGSHRQFTLLARALAASGIPSLRFDYRGMGDSEGDIRTFEQVAEDLGTAMDALAASCPRRGIVIWGLCDAASAALLYAVQDARVTGLVLLNPWVRTSEGEARALVKHYYAKRLTDPDLWRKLLRGQFQVGKALSDLIVNVKTATKPAAPGGDVAHASCSTDTRALSLPDRMVEALERYKGRVLVVLAGNDLTAREFSDVASGSKRWRRLLADNRISKREVPDATHTFSSVVWRDAVAQCTSAWVLAIDRP